MSFKRLMLIISVVVGTVFAGSASRANTFAQDTVRAEMEKNSELTRGRAPAMEEDFAVPMHGGDPTMEEHFDPASFTPVGGENSIPKTPENTANLCGKYTLDQLEQYVEIWRQMNGEE
jgi:hypothetical protein